MWPVSAEVVEVALPHDAWKLVQEALDAYFYDVEHARSGGLTISGRRERADARTQRLEQLRWIDQMIGEATGGGPYFAV
jgi:hypothetical protein